jgi:hypothetical protein
MLPLRASAKIHCMHVLSRPTFVPIEQKALELPPLVSSKIVGTDAESGKKLLLVPEVNHLEQFRWATRGRSSKNYISYLTDG